MIVVLSMTAIPLVLWHCASVQMHHALGGSPSDMLPAGRTMLTAPDIADYSQIPPLPSGVCVAPLQRPAGLVDDWLEPVQRKCGSAEHRIWDELFARQMKLVQSRACSEFLRGLERLDLNRGGVPSLVAINARLARRAPVALRGDAQARA